MKTRDFRAIPGMVLDARGQIAVAILSEEAVGVSIARYDRFLSPTDLQVAINSDRWVTVYREFGGDLFVVEPQSEEGEEDDLILVTPQENESGQFAIELALLAWPEWCPEYRDKYKPKLFIPFPQKLPEA
jgi:hypothetical protein